MKRKATLTKGGLENPLQIKGEDLEGSLEWKEMQRRREEIESISV